MTIKELYELFEKVFPSNLSCEWDHDGLQVCSDPNKQVQKVLLTLDITNDVIDMAIKNKVDVIISHHPLLFKPTSEVTLDSLSGKKVLSLVRNNISCMSFHTRADVQNGGVSDLLAKSIGLNNIQVYGEEGLLRLGTLNKPTNVLNFCQVLKDQFNAPFISYTPIVKTIQKVIVCGGEGKDEIRNAIASGADAFVTGSVGYHCMQDAMEMGLCVFELGHFYSEIEILDLFQSIVPNGIEILMNKSAPLSSY